MRARRKSVPVRVGDVVIGGAAEIVVQSMTKADTRDVKATLNEIARLKDVNCRIVRVAVPTREAAQAMVEIKKGSPLPIIADNSSRANKKPPGPIHSSSWPQCGRGQAKGLVLDLTGGTREELERGSRTAALGPRIEV